MSLPHLDLASYFLLLFRLAFQNQFTFEESILETDVDSLFCNICLFINIANWADGKQVHREIWDDNGFPKATLSALQSQAVVLLASS